MEPLLKKQPITIENNQSSFIKGTAWLSGIIITFSIAIIASILAKLPGLSFIGPMLLAILLGMTVKQTVSLPLVTQPGITFSSKMMLRAGIVLLGFRLNIQDIAHAGMGVVGIDLLVIAITLGFMLWLGKTLQLERTLTALIAVGTAVCGAAAIAAIAPIVKAKKETTVLAVALIAITGTIGAIIFTLLFSLIQPDPIQYGIFVGATLHEVAHVVAAGAIGGAKSADSAIIVKLGRVLFLIPVALLFVRWESSKEKRLSSKQNTTLKSLHFPWFIVGFLAICLINTFVMFPTWFVNNTLYVSTLFLTMGMAGLGLGVNFSTLRKVGKKFYLLTFIGALAILVVGFVGVLLL